MVTPKILRVNIESKYWVVVPSFTSRDEFLAIAMKNYKKTKVKIFRIVCTSNFLLVIYPSLLQASIYFDDFYNFRAFFKYLIFDNKAKNNANGKINSFLEVFFRIFCSGQKLKAFNFC